MPSKNTQPKYTERIISEIEVGNEQNLKRMNFNLDKKLGTLVPESSRSKIYI